jgi:hypothetical protein
MSVKRTLSQLDVEDSPSASLLGLHLDFSPHRFGSRRRKFVIALGSLLSIISLLILAYISFFHPPLVLPEDNLIQPDRALSSNRKAPLLGPPTSRFRGMNSVATFFPCRLTFFSLDNLRDDTKYITSWISAGWSS